MVFQAILFPHLSAHSTCCEMPTPGTTNVELEITSGFVGLQTAHQSSSRLLHKGILSLYLPQKHSTSNSITE